MYTKKILMRMDWTKVNAFCNICNDRDMDINVMCGRDCRDGKSVLGMVAFNGRIVEIIPVTDDEAKYEEFYSRVKAIGAY